MFWPVVAAVLSPAIIAVCKLAFGALALRGVPPRQRAEVVRAIGEAWGGWRRFR